MDYMLLLVVFVAGLVVSRYLLPRVVVVEKETPREEKIDPQSLYALGFSEGYDASRRGLQYHIKPRYVLVGKIVNRQFAGMYQCKHNGVRELFKDVVPQQRNNGYSSSPEPDFPPPVYDEPPYTH